MEVHTFFFGRKSKSSTGEKQKPHTYTYGYLFGELYEKTFYSVGYICDSPIAKIEIMAYYIFFFDLLALSTRKDRQVVFNSVKEYISNNFSDVKDTVFEVFESRSILYANVYNRAIKAFGAWKFVDDPLIDSNRGYASFIALCDILWNPGCATNYDSAPVMIRDFDDAIKFDEKVRTTFTSVISEIKKSGLF